MRITANHAHLMPTPSEGDWWPHGDAGMLLRHLDACGIERALVFPPFANQMQGNMLEANRWALRTIRPHADRLLPAGTIFPLAPTILEALQLLHDEGVRLAKIHPSIDLHDIADPKAAVCYARAAEFGIALDYHTGPHGSRLSWATPQKFDNLAWEHPQLKLVFEHLGGKAYIEEFSAVLANHPGRTFGGLTSIFDAQHNYLWHIEPERVQALIRGLGADRFIFGLDFPWNSVEVTRRDLRLLQSMELTAEEVERILGGNLEGLVG